MSNEIYVNTVTVGTYESRLSEIKKSVSNITSNIRWHAQLHGYDNIKWLLDKQDSPVSDYYFNRLDKNIGYLSTMQSEVERIEQYLTQIDPLDYDASVAALDQSTWDLVNDFLEVVEEYLIKFAAKYAGTPGKIISIMDNLRQIY